MEFKIVQMLAQHGPWALIAGLLIYLYILMWKRGNEVMKQQMAIIIDDTKAKGQLVGALEDVVRSIDVLGKSTIGDLAHCKRVMEGLARRIESDIDDRRIAKAREEGRREAVNPRYKIPGGGGR